MDLAFYKDRLSAAGVSFDDGLTDEEFSTIEREYGFHFPPDLREFLSYALPVSDGWLDWRRESRTEILRQLEWPLEGMCFDISKNAFWLDSWGPKPPALSDAYAVARAAVAQAPRLIPICGHRYLPDRPREAGNPVFSVYQTDIIYYGKDLFDYFCNEYHNFFGRREDFVVDGDLRRIEFWSDVMNHF